MGEHDFMRKAIGHSIRSVRDGGGPFGAVIVRDGRIVASGRNRVVRNNDPTAHAEMCAIRAACRKLKHFKLDGCEIYTSCEPCPMCLAALYWTGIKKIWFANTRHDAAEIGFDDSFIYDEVNRPATGRSIPSQQLLRDEALAAFRLWEEKGDRVEY